MLCICLIVLAGCSNKISVTSNDETGPYINLSKYEFETSIGNSIDFSNISAYDDVDGLMPVFVKGYINYNLVGEYYPTLYSIDTSGNETDIIVTVRVLDTEYVEVSDTTADDNEELIEEETCTKEGTDNNYACDVVLPSVASNYTMLYLGEEGKERCEKNIVIKDEDETSEKQSVVGCEIIYTNDGSFWGYGLKKEN